MLVDQSSLTLRSSVDNSQPGNSVHGILQARILERIIIPFSRGSPQPQNQVSCTAGRFFTIWVTSISYHILLSIAFFFFFFFNNKQELAILIDLAPTIFWPPYAKSWLIGKDSCWEGLGARGEGDDRGWDGWMASLTRWTWVSVNSGSWWRTGRPGVLWFMGSKRVRHDWATDLIWSDLIYCLSNPIIDMLSIYFNSFK